MVASVVVVVFGEFESIVLVFIVSVVALVKVNVKLSLGGSLVKFEVVVRVVVVVAWLWIAAAW